MLLRLTLAAIVLLTTATGSEPCLTPQLTLCRTIQWEVTGWENGSWGLHDVSRWTGTITLAYSRDGKSLERYSSRDYRNYLIPTAHSDKATIERPAENQRFEVDHIDKKYEVYHPSGMRPVWDADDPDCARKATRFLLSKLRRVGESTIAGIPAVQYAGFRSSTESQWVWLAPSLGCTQMKVVRYDHNSLGLPTSYWRTEVTAIEIGDPNPNLFRVPAGYRPSP